MTGLASAIRKAFEKIFGRTLTGVPGHDRVSAMSKTKPAPMSLNDALRAARGALNQTQGATAAELEVPFWRFHQWEQGRPIEDEYREKVERWVRLALPGVLIA